MKIKISPEEFWGLSLYEWVLYLERYRNEQEEKFMFMESLWNMVRILWSTILNRHRSSSEPIYKGEDLIKLSFDKPEKESKPDFKKAKQILGSRFPDGK